MLHSLRFRLGFGGVVSKGRAAINGQSSKTICFQRSFRSGVFTPHALIRTTG